MSESWKCMECGTTIEYDPEYCCDGRECGCMGLPIEPPLCGNCWDKISAGMEEQRHGNQAINEPAAADT